MKASQVKSSQVKSSQVQDQSLFFPGQRLLQARKSALSQFAKTSTAAIRNRSGRTLVAVNQSQNSLSKTRGGFPTVAAETRDRRDPQRDPHARTHIGFYL